MQGFCYPDLSVPGAYNWVLSEMIRIVEKYGVRWLKVDCNSDFSSDPHHRGHQVRMARWYNILDELAGRFPDLVMEGCASGGLRNDLRSASHFHTSFLSDTVDPVDVVRIGMSSLSWLSPRMIAKWAVMYPTGNGWTPYDREAFDTGDQVLCPLDVTSARVASHYLEFAMHAAMTGVLGISGNIAGLSSMLKSKVAEQIEFYKKHREFIQNAIGIPLTPVEPISKRDGVAMIQLSDHGFQKNMIFVYNMQTCGERIQVKPVGLCPEVDYVIMSECGDVIAPVDSGRTVLEGFEIDCAPSRSRIILVENRGEG